MEFSVMKLWQGGHLVGQNPCNQLIFLHLKRLSLICLKNAFSVGLKLWSGMA
jgi:hypothetical protein